MTERCRWRGIELWLVMALAACVGTPQPDPPNADPDVEGDLIVLVPPVVRSTTVTLAGAAGAVSPAGAVLRLYNLDDQTPPLQVTPAVDGSFSVTFAASWGDELRLFARQNERFSTPLDLLLTPTGLTPAPRPLAGCLRVEPEVVLPVPAGGQGSVELTNDCPEAVRLSQVAMRGAGSPFVVGQWPSTVGSGERVVREVALAPAAPPGEDILLIEVEQPQSDRRPVTLVGRESE